MKTFAIEKGVPFVVALIAIGVLAAWVRSYNRDLGIRDRPLGLETSANTAEKPVSAVSSLPVQASQAVTVAKEPVAIEEISASWPQFRGPHADNVSRETVDLADRFPPEGPPLLWSVDLGEGYASAAVHRGRVFVLDYDSVSQADVLRSFSLANGQELWRRSYPVVVKRNHGMSRTVPAVNDKYVVTLGPKCHLMCCDPATGK